VTGSTVTHCSPSSSAVTRTTAQDEMVVRIAGERMYL
jgi:transposase-like protein